jgi:hypothetical protein
LSGDENGYNFDFIDDIAEEGSGLLNEDILENVFEVWVKEGGSTPHTFSAYKMG